MSSEGNVLVVDDDRAVGMVLVGLLRQAGHDAAHVSSAEEALLRAGSRPIDVIVTDLRMPGWTGWSCSSGSPRRRPACPSSC